VVEFKNNSGLRKVAKLSPFHYPGYDIAILSVKKPPEFFWHPGCYDLSVQKGTKVWHIGTNDKIETDPNYGFISEVTPNDECFFHSTSIKEGCSGGALITDKGIAGMVFLAENRGGWGYSINKIKSILEYLGFSFEDFRFQELIEKVKINDRTSHFYNGVEKCPGHADEGVIFENLILFGTHGFKYYFTINRFREWGSCPPAKPWDIKPGPQYKGCYIQADFEVAECKLNLSNIKIYLGGLQDGNTGIDEYILESLDKINHTSICSGL
jgi:hypothetical protein